MEDESSPVPLIRIVVLGDSNVGKTCLLNRYVGNCFAGESEPSFPDLITLQTMVDGIHAKLYIFETVGNESFNCFSEISYRNANAVIICVDPTNFESYLRMNYWLHDILDDEFAKECKIYICCTKFDLVRNSGHRFALEAMNLKSKSMRTQLFATSSKTGEGIEPMFQQIVRDMVKTLQYDCISNCEVQGKHSNICEPLHFLNQLRTVSRSLPDSIASPKHWKSWIVKPRVYSLTDSDR